MEMGSQIQEVNNRVLPEALRCFRSQEGKQYCCHNSVLVFQSVDLHGNKIISQEVNGERAGLITY